jgi:hypothetical protein
MITICKEYDKCGCDNTCYWGKERIKYKVFNRKRLSLLKQECVCMKDYTDISKKLILIIGDEVENEDH